MPEEYESLEDYKEALGLSVVYLQPEDELKFEEIINTLSDMLKPEGMIPWLNDRMPFFAWKSAKELMAEGDFNTVLGAVTAWAEGSFG